PFDWLALAGDRQAPIRLPRDRDDAAIDLRRVGRIDGELRAAGLLAFFQGRRVEERETHPAPDLEHAIAGEEYRRGVGIDAPDLGTAVAVRVGEEAEHFVLI